jgi:hypothetical protein
MRKYIRAPHDIAVIGFPKSGITTLITSIFMFCDSKYDALFKGENKIDEDIEKLKIKEKLVSTTNHDGCLYRVDISNIF